MDELKIKFLEKVKEFGCKNESIALNFFVTIDAAIKRTEADRVANDWKLKNEPKARWLGVNFDDTLQTVIAYSNLGIDPMADDMLSFVFYKNKAKTGYDIVFVEGVSCMEILARRYGINCPENIKVEIVFSTDIFKEIKKDINNPEDTCIHEITNSFDRGDIVGGYALSQFKNTAHNQLRVLSLKDIHKRTKESTSFYKQWPVEMCVKTLKKHSWSKVVLNTTDLAEYYATKKVDPTEFDPTDKSKLPFDPDGEI